MSCAIHSQPISIFSPDRIFIATGLNNYKSTAQAQQLKHSSSHHAPPQPQHTAISDCELLFLLPPPPHPPAPTQPGRKVLRSAGLEIHLTPLPTSEAWDLRGANRTRLERSPRVLTREYLIPYRHYGFVVGVENEEPARSESGIESKTQQQQDQCRTATPPIILELLPPDPFSLCC